MYKEVPSFGHEISQAIQNDYLIVVLITSHTKGKNEALNLPYGLGKSTLWLWLLYAFCGANWDNAFASAFYNPIDYAHNLMPCADSVKRKPVAGWDDVQLTAPSEKSVPRHIVGLANYLTTTRPECALHVWTAPNINAISAPLRRLVTHELIVYERGKYEVQKITYKKNFDNPSQDYAKLTYIEEGSFEQLPTEIQHRYNDWREKQKKRLFGKMEKDLAAYVRLEQFTEPEGQNAFEMEGTIVKANVGYVFKLPKDVGEKLYQKQVKLRGMV